MMFPFQSVAQRIRSWFTPQKPRTFQHRSRLLVEHLEDRVVPANLLANPSFETGTFASWSVAGNSVDVGVSTDGTNIGTFTLDSFDPTYQNVRTGTYAAHAIIRTSPLEQVFLGQTLVVTPNTTYDVGYYVGVDSANSSYGMGSFENQTLVNGVSISLTGLGGLSAGSAASSFLHIFGTYTTGPTQTSATVSYRISGSGTGRAGFSLDDFHFSTINQPPTTPSDANSALNTVAEGAAYGTPVGITAFSTDPNGQLVSYSLTDNAGGRFAINSSTGVVSVANGALLDGPASHGITVQASDGIGETSSANFTIGVTNVAPSNLALSLSPTSINENGSTTLSGSFLDPGTLDTHTVNINWGDGSPNTIVNLGAGALNISGVTHQYLDDNPSGTSSDSYQLTVNLTDDDGQSAQASLVTVFFQGHMNSADGDFSAGEVFTGSFTFNPSTAGVDHPDSTLNFQYVPAVTAWNIAFPAHGYSFTGTSGSISAGNNTTFGDRYIVSMFSVTSTGVPLPTGRTVSFMQFDIQDHVSGGADLLSDDSIQIVPPNLALALVKGGRVVFTNNDQPQWTLDQWGNAPTVTVNNVAPVANAGADQSVNEGVPVTLNGSFTDVGVNDGHKQEWSVVASNGQVVSPLTINPTAAGDSNGAGASGFSFTPNDNGTYTVSYKVTDDDGGTHTDTAVITVNNVAPLLTNLALTSSIIEGGVAHLTGTITDPGTLDVFTLTVNWGEGAPQTYTLPAGSTSFDVTHPYLDDDPTATSADNYTVSTSLTDDDGGAASVTRTVTAWTGLSATPKVNPGDSAFVENGTHVEAFWALSIGTLSGSFTSGHFHGSGTEPQHFNGSDQLQGFFLESADGSPFDLVSLKYRVTNPNSTINGYSLGSVQILLSTTFNPTQTVASQFTGIGVGGSMMWSFVTLPVSGFTNVTRVFIASTASVEFDDIIMTAGPAPRTVTVNNVAPVANAGADQSVNEGALVTLNGGFTDVGVNDGHKQEWSVVASNGQVVTPLTINPTATGDSNGAGASSFSFTPNDNGIYTVSYMVTDDDGGTHTDTATITVNNVAPTIAISGALNVSEGSSYSLTLGTVTDPGADTVSSYIVHWGDGATDTYATNGVKTHTYADGPNSRAVTVDLVDDDGTFINRANAHTVTVNNIAPTVTLVGLNSVNEGQTINYRFTTSDPGVDTFVLSSITAGPDATISNQVFNPANGAGSFDVTFLDGPNTTIVSVVVEDSDGIPSHPSSIAVAVANVAPTVTLVGVASANEGRTHHYTFTTSDPGLDTFTIGSITAGPDATISNQAFNPATGSGSFDVMFLDGPNTSTVSVQVKDSDDAASNVSSIAVAVANVAPTVTLVGPSSANEGQLKSYTYTTSDPGVDTFSVVSVTAGPNATISNQLFNSATGAGSFDVTFHEGPNTTTVSVQVKDSDDAASNVSSIAVAVANVAPTAPVDNSGAANQVLENAANGTAVGVTAASTDPGILDTVTYSLTDNAGGRFAIHASTGVVTVANGSLLDYETATSHNITVQASDGQGGASCQTFTISLLNVTARISGTVFVDVDGDTLFDGGAETGINGVSVELFNSGGTVLATNPTELGGVYAFVVNDELGTYRIREIQPTGVTNGAAILGSAAIDSVLSANEMQLTLAGADASDYDFTEVGSSVNAGDTATIGFWQNKNGQALINQGGAALVNWLNANFANIFGATFANGSGGDNAAEVASFYKTEFFMKKLQGTSKVDAQFMATALAAFFTSSNLSGGNMAAGYGFNVTATGIGTKIVNVGASGAAFNVANNTNMTIMALLQATNNLTGASTNGSYRNVYDLNGDGVLDDAEKALRALANSIYSAINEGGDIS